jgi:hypothetical protein
MTDQFRIGIGQNADPDLAQDGAKVMRARRPHRDRTHHDQFTQALHIRKFGHCGHCLVAPAEHLLQVHLGDATCGVLRVVIVGGVDHQRLEQGLDAGFDFLPKCLALDLGVNELGNIVVGMKAPARVADALANDLRHGAPGVVDAGARGFAGQGFDVGGVAHRVILPAL